MEFKIDYFKIQQSVIKSKLNTKEVNQKNVALWQTVGLLNDQEFIDLMVLIDAEYPVAPEESDVPEE